MKRLLIPAAGLLAAFAWTPLQAAPFAAPLDSKPLDRTNHVRLTSFSDVLKKVTPAVVSVYPERVVKIVRGGRNPQEEMLRRLLGLPGGNAGPATVEERKLPQGVGSGVIISADGYLVTNNHVVTDQAGNEADEVKVGLSDGREFAAKIVGRDPRTDIAVLKIDAKDLPTVVMADSDKVEVGDIVFAVGNPLGVGLTVTQGIVSAQGRAIGIYGKTGYENFIQTDASINPGNSGGALVDADGRLVGVNSAILSQTGNSIGIGFAIPTRLVSQVMSDLVNHGEVRRGFLGVGTGDLDASMAEYYGLSAIQGVIVNEISPGSAAEKAGLRRGDVITSLAGKAVKDERDFRWRVAQATPGTTLAIEIVRMEKKKPRTLSLTANLGEYGKTSTAPANEDELIKGVTAESLTEELRKSKNIPDDISGLMLTEVSPKSPYADLLQSGMVLVEVNDRTVKSLDEARKALSPGMNKLYVWRDGRSSFLVVKIS